MQLRHIATQKHKTHCSQVAVVREVEQLVVLVVGAQLVQPAVGQLSARRQTEMRQSRQKMTDSATRIVSQLIKA